MAKKKRRFLQTAEIKVGKTAIEGAPKENPFELRVNRKKHEVIGRKVKGERGNLIKSRTAAVEKRKRTLLPQLATQGKNNAFLDRRIGEKDANLTVEEKMLMRFSAERKKRSEKSGLFNLNDEDDGLTHMGRSLAEIDDFDDRDLRLSDDEDAPALDAHTVSEMHFGGFERADALSSAPSDPNRPRTRKEIMAEVVAKSKLHKLERQKEKEEFEDKTAELDDEFTSLMRHGLLAPRNKHNDREDPGDRPKADDYDKAVRSLAFDAKAKATDRLKTDEELAKENFERLKRMEAQRLARMRGDETLLAAGEGATDAAKKVDDSVEELGGNVALDRDTSEVYYEDGVLMKDGQNLDLRMRQSKVADDQETSEEEDDDEEEEEEEEGEEDEEEEEGGEGEGGEEEDDEDESSDIDEDASDLDLEGEEEEDEEGEDEEIVLEKPKPKPKAADQSHVRVLKIDDSKPVAKTATSGAAAAANDNLPFTFPAPETLNDWLELVEDRSAKEVLTIVVRLRACHHVSLHPDNRAKLERFYAILVEYMGYLCDNAKTLDPELVRTLLDKLPIVLFSMGGDMPLAAAEAFRTELVWSLRAFSVAQKRGANSTKPCISPRALVCLRAITLLFSTSDQQHPVATPAAYLMGNILSNTPLRHPADLLSVLFVASVFLQFVQQSKRFVPEVVTLLTSLVAKFVEVNAALVPTGNTETTNSARKTKPAAGKSKVAKSAGDGAPDNGVAMATDANTDAEMAEGETKRAPVAARAGSDNEVVSAIPIVRHMVEDLLKVEKKANEVDLEPFAVVSTLVRQDIAVNDTYRWNVLNTCLLLLRDSATLWGGLKCFDAAFAPALKHLSALAELDLPESIKASVTSLTEHIESLSVKCVSGRTHMLAQKRKPIPLPQFNPKFEEKYVIGQSYDPDKERRESRKLKHLYKKELKGAKRELQKDAAFLAKARFRERQELDEDRKQKTKRLFSLLADQQAETNENKRLKKKLKAKKT